MARERILNHQSIVPLLVEPAAKVWRIADPGGTPVFTDITTAFNNATTGDVHPWPTGAGEAIGDRMAIGYSRPFRRARFIIATAGIGGTMKPRFWDGAAMQDCAGEVDGTVDFTAVAGTYEITVDMPAMVAQILSDDTEARFYLYLEVLTVYATNPILSRGWVLRGNPIVIPEVDERAGSPAMIIRALNTDADADAFVTKQGHDNRTSELVAKNYGRIYEGPRLNWDQLAGAAPELYSADTAPDPVLVTLLGSP